MMSSEKIDVSSTSDTDGELSLVDCDVHPYYEPDELVEYLPEHYAEQQGYNIPTGMWTDPTGGFRDDATPVGGGTPGSDPELLVEQALDGPGADYAMLNAGEVLALTVSPQAEYAHALARAYNEWFLDKWLDYDDRFIGSMIVAPQRPQKAAEMIRDLGDHPRVRQVLMGSATETPYGRPAYWPIYEAAEELGLPIAIHPGPEGMGTAPPNGGAGYSSTYFEKHSGAIDHYIGQITSMVAEGVFVEYPDLDFVLLEGGFTWVPTLLWRADKDWKSLRAEVPYLERPPSEYIIENCYFGTQPTPQPDDPSDLVDMMDMMQPEKTLLYCSDYPHWDSAEYGLPELPKPVDSRIRYRTAQELYDLPDDPSALG